MRGFRARGRWLPTARGRRHRWLRELGVGFASDGSNPTRLGETRVGKGARGSDLRWDSDYGGPCGVRSVEIGGGRRLLGVGSVSWRRGQTRGGSKVEGGSKGGEKRGGQVGLVRANPRTEELLPAAAARASGREEGRVSAQGSSAGGEVVLGCPGEADCGLEGATRSYGDRSAEEERGMSQPKEEDGGAVLSFFFFLFGS